ncbi:MAG: methionine--tRNA ligase [Desulfurococcales archaeon]|jgi:tRNA-binding protein|nr:methionine--tRNA ligase [Desulfurococcales archaeon]
MQVLTIDEFSKVDLRVGIVRNASRIEGTGLLRLIIDLGPLGERQIIAGIGRWYEPDKLIGKRVIVVANLKPKTIRGYISEGMILAAGCEKDERPLILTIDGEPDPGTKVC